MTENLRVAQGGVPLSDVITTARIAFVRKRLGRTLIKVQEKNLNQLSRQGRAREQYGQKILMSESVHSVGEMLRRHCQQLENRHERRTIYSLIPSLLSSKPTARTMRRAVQHIARTKVDYIDPHGAAVYFRERGLEPAWTQDGETRPWGFLVRYERNLKRSTIVQPRVQPAEALNLTTSFTHFSVQDEDPYSWMLAANEAVT